MQSRSRKLALGAIVIVVTVLAGCGYAFRANPEMFARLYVESVAKELELNEVQTAKLNFVKDVALKARTTMRAGREQKQQAVLDLLDRPAVDRQRALNLAREATHEMEGVAADVIVAFSDFYDSLAPSQQEKVRTTIKERLERFSR